MRAATALLLTWLAAATSASAQSLPESVQAYFDGYDEDRNGRVSETEFVAYLSRGFDALDRNGDGRLLSDELGSSARLRQPRSRDQHVNALRAAFRRQDVNRDGSLNPLELVSPPR